MFFFSDDSSILRKAQLEFVSDAKNAHALAEIEKIAMKYQGIQWTRWVKKKNELA